MSVLVNKNKYLVFSSISILFHGIVIVILIALSKLIPEQITLPKISNPFKIKKISKNQLERIRRLGVKDGSIKNNSASYIKTTPGTHLTLGDLSAEKSEVQDIKKVDSKGPVKAANSSPFTITKQSRLLNQKMQQEIRQKSKHSFNALPGYMGENFYSHIIPPKGVSPDEFNSLEKRFYGFKKREFEGVLSSFNTTFNKAVRRHPNLSKEILGQKHVARLRVIRDAEGHVVSIKVLKAAQNDNVHRFILDAFMEFKKLNNIPKEILRDDEYHAYWEIRFN